MKKLIFILILFTAIKSYSQNITPFIGANKIIVKNNDSASQNFLFIKNILKRDKIKIVNENKNTFTIKTKYIKIPKTEEFVFFNISCKENQIEINGGYKIGEDMYIGGKEFKGAYLNIVYIGERFVEGEKLKRTIPIVYPFLVMDRFAKSIGASIEYLAEIR